MTSIHLLGLPGYCFSQRKKEVSKGQIFTCSLFCHYVPVHVLSSREINVRWMSNREKAYQYNNDYNTELSAFWRQKRVLPEYRGGAYKSEDERVGDIKEASWRIFRYRQKKKERISFPTEGTICVKALKSLCSNLEMSIQARNRKPRTLFLLMGTPTEQFYKDQFLLRRTLKAAESLLHPGWAGNQPHQSSKIEILHHHNLSPVSAASHDWERMPRFSLGREEEDWIRRPMFWGFLGGCCSRDRNLSCLNLSTNRKGSQAGNLRKKMVAWLACKPLL